MPDDTLNHRNQQINWDINFPTINKGDQDKEYALFHCYSCGFHPMVICETRPKGENEIVQIRLINIAPKEYKIIDTMGDKLPGDIETTEVLICGGCGNVGTIDNVPEFILILNGVISPDINHNDSQGTELDEK